MIYRIIRLKTAKLTVLWPALVLLILDQGTKIWVRSAYALGESHRVLGDEFFRLTRVENTGVAFGLQPGSVTFLTIFNALASLLLIYFLLKPHSDSPPPGIKLQHFALTFILGGALGNLTDRLLFGHVTDFLDFDFPDFIMTRWPVFNVADSAVSVGVTLWAIYLIFLAKAKTVEAPSPSSKSP